MQIKEFEPMMSAAMAAASETRSDHDIPTEIDSVRERVKSRIRTDDAFAYALLSEAVEVLLADDMVTAKSVLFDYIDATIGFEELALQSGLAAETLREMFSPAGDPRAADLFRVLGVLQQYQGIHLEVSAAA